MQIRNQQWKVVWESSADTLDGADLQGTSLKGARLEERSLRNARLDGADLQGANLKGANLQDACLLNADLEGASLEGADLRGATLSGAGLERAKLRGAVFDRETCWPAGFSPRRAGCVYRSRPISGRRLHEARGAWRDRLGIASQGFFLIGIVALVIHLSLGMLDEGRVSNVGLPHQPAAHPALWIMIIALCLGFVSHWCAELV